MLRRFFILFLLGAMGVCAQTSTEPNLGSRLSVNNATVPATYTFSWWGKSGCSYLVMSSPDLITWGFFPNYNPSGANAVLNVQFLTSANKYFFRTLQFDPNDVPSSVDADGDGLPDQWEKYYFGNLNRDGSGDADNDSITDRDEFQLGLNPNSNEVSPKTAIFTYDAIGRLTAVSGNNNATSFTLDAEANITKTQ